MPRVLNEAAKERYAIEAKYQQYLIEKGLWQAANNAQEYRFDPQGHIILKVMLTDDDYQNLYYYVQNQNIPKKGKVSAPNAKNYLSQFINFDPEKPTYCNLDIKGHPTLEAAYKSWVIDKNQDERLSLAVGALLNSPSRSSVIALQEEMEMHLRLSARVLQQIISKEYLNNADWENIINAATKKLNELVRDEFQKALLESFNEKNGKVNFSHLNKMLANARKKIAPNCKTILTTACMSDQRFIAAYPKAALKKELFKATTATGLDYLRTDAGNQSVTRVIRTEETAHNKTSKNQAHRILHRNPYTVNNNGNVAVSVNSIPRAHARVPSIALNEKSHMGSVLDVFQKLDEDYKQLQTELCGYDGPMTYNLLTSLHSKLWDGTVDRKNKQRASAARILKGAHVFNKRQVKLGKPNSIWYVQNIGVNQHTSNLGYKSGPFANALTTEATLMSEIAMLHNLLQNADCLPQVMREKIKAEYKIAHGKYVSFLKENSQGNLYFKNFPEGKKVIAQIKNFKTYLVKNTALLNPQDTDSVAELATKALAKMMATNKHWNSQFGMLVQSFSVFTEYASQAGCKSANERYQLVAGRVDYLMSLQDKSRAEFQETENKFIRVLTAFINGEATMIHLQRAFDTAFNVHNVYGVATVFSEEDQGAPAKVLTSSSEKSGKIGKLEFFNTNKAESGYVGYFKGGPGSMQAHKADHAKDLKTQIQTQSSKISPSKDH